MRVTQIDLRTTKVVTLDGNYVIIPNSTLTKSNVSNWSHGSKISRFHICVGVACSSDANVVENVERWRNILNALQQACHCPF